MQTDKQKELIEKYCNGEITGKEFTDAIDSSTSVSNNGKPHVSSRFFIDERVGCIAVRDKKHPEYNENYPGLHNDTADVIFYAHGSINENGLFVDERWRRKAEEVLKHLMSLENGC